MPPFLETIAPAAIQLGMQAAQNELNKSWQEKMYNQYQSPAAMVRQYKEAGLNPALMYGQNLQTQFNQPATQTPLDALGAAQIAAQIRNTEANTANIEADTQAKSIENTFKPQQFQLDLRQRELNYENTLAGLHKLGAEINEIDSRTMLNRIQSTLTESQISNILANTEKTKVETVSEQLRQQGIPASNALIAAQLVSEQLKPAVMAAEISLMQMQGFHYAASSSELVERTQGIRLDNFEKQWEKEFRDKTGVKDSQPVWNTMTTLLGHMSFDIVHGQIPSFLLPTGLFGALKPFRK